MFHEEVFRLKFLRISLPEQPIAEFVAEKPRKECSLAILSHTSQPELKDDKIEGETSMIIHWNRSMQVIASLAGLHVMPQFILHSQAVESLQALSLLLLFHP